MKYRINYYADRKVTFNRIHIMDPRVTGTNIKIEKKDATVEYHNEYINDSQFIVPWQLT